MSLLARLWAATAPSRLHHPGPSPWRRAARRRRVFPERRGSRDEFPRNRGAGLAVADRRSPAADRRSDRAGVLPGLRRSGGNRDRGVRVAVRSRRGRAARPVRHLCLGRRDDRPARLCERGDRQHGPPAQRPGRSARRPERHGDRGGRRAFRQGPRGRQRVERARRPRSSRRARSHNGG